MSKKTSQAVGPAMFHFIAVMLFYKFLGSACAVGVASDLEVHAIEWLGTLNASEVVVAITPPSAF